MILTLLLAVLIAMAVIMTIGWTVQRGLNNGGWTDVFWTYGTGATCALAALAPFGGQTMPNLRQGLVAALLVVWAVRLGTYVAVRVVGGPEDVRYVTLRGDWGAAFQPRMFLLMIVQAPATTLLSISVILAAQTPAPTLRLQDLLGVLILVGAIVGEAVADGQMKRFKADPSNKGKVCDVGLWAWSRHPNYLFEFAGWFAYPMIAIDLHHPMTLASLIAPAVMFAVVRYGSGVPPLEAAMVESKGDSYRRYQARVSPLLPRPPKDVEPKESAA